MYILLDGETSSRESDEAVWAKVEFAEGFRGVCMGSAGEVLVGISVTL